MHHESARLPLIRLLVAHSQRMFAEALDFALAEHAEFEVLPIHPTKGKQAIEAILLERPDVVLLDFWLPGVGGPEVVSTVLKWDPAAKILLMSWAHGTDHIAAGIEAGAVGFLPRGLSVAQVAEGIRQAAAGERLVFAEELQKHKDRIVARSQKAQEAWSRVGTISPRETRVLALMSEGHLPEEIAEKLGIRRGTVNNHIHHIMKKCGVRSQAEAIALARAAGLLGSRPSKQQ